MSKIIETTAADKNGVSIRLVHRDNATRPFAACVFDEDAGMIVPFFNCYATIEDARREFAKLSTGLEF